MNEEFLQFIWKTRFEKKSVTTVSGEKVLILRPGDQNGDAGPDFLNAMVRIGNTTWAGSVEIHVRASDWVRHGHHHNQAYDNVVLHAVYEYDGPVYRTTGEEIPSIILKDHISKRAYSAYLDFLNNHLWIPCAQEIHQVAGESADQLLMKLSISRINQRSEQIRKLLGENKGDWNQAFFESLSGTLGARINKDPFTLLARKTPVQVILKNRGGTDSLEALFFGQAGFLDNHFKEDYPKFLSSEYQHLKNKYTLDGIPAYLWKFLRLRPVNFPTIRIAQLASLYHQQPLPFGALVDTEDPLKWTELFDLNVSEYWKTHYHFDILSVKKEKRIGQDTIVLIMINTAIPFLYTFGMTHGKKKIAETAIDFLQTLPAESNSIIRTFGFFGIECSNAMHSQGALELKKNWCDQRRCLDCGIGQELLKKVL